MKTKTDYNGKRFQHGEIVYTPNVLHDELTNVKVSFKLITRTDSVDNFRNELSVLIEKYTKQ